MQLSAAVAAIAIMAGATEANQVSGNKKYEKSSPVNYELEKFDEIFSPKAVVVNYFAPEAAVWHKYQSLTNNITLPGLSPLYPNVSCTHNYDLCQITTGEGEINAAASITALLASAKFNLTETYFLANGIAGLDPQAGVLGSAAFARFAVTVDLQNEVAIREAPSNWSTGYFPYGSKAPGQFPSDFYGTEVFEVNEKLRDYAAGLAANATLKSNSSTFRTNALYNISTANRGPQVLKCDVATSDVYYTGAILSETFANTSKLFSNGSAKYCVTAQEDTAILEAAIRAAKFGLTDFSRWVLLRTASEYDRPPAVLPANSTIPYFFSSNSTSGFDIAIENLYRAGAPFVEAVISKWNSTFINATNIVNSTKSANSSSRSNRTKGGNSTNSTRAKNGTLGPDNYVGDVFGSLGGEPDFGPGSYKDYAYI